MRPNIVQFYVYIMGSANGKCVYVGVTNDLQRRVWEHKHFIHEGFSKRYRCTWLLYFEKYKQIEAAILREKQLKSITRKRKEALILDFNPERKDLAALWNKR